MGKDHIKRVNQLKEKRNSRNDSDEEAALTKYAKYPKPKQIFFKYVPFYLQLKVARLISIIMGRVSEPDPYWIRIQSGHWIRIRIRDPDPDPEGQKCRRDPLICSTLMFRTSIFVRLIFRYVLLFLAIRNSLHFFWR
jgi:hypothetical protein